MRACVRVYLRVRERACALQRETANAKGKWAEASGRSALLEQVARPTGTRGPAGTHGSAGPAGRHGSVGPLGRQGSAGGHGTLLP